MTVFCAGQRVRIAADAFPGSYDAVDIAARGQEARLVQQYEADTPVPLWQAVLMDYSGYEVWPSEAELEQVEVQP